MRSQGYFLAHGHFPPPPLDGVGRVLCSRSPAPSPLSPFLPPSLQPVWREDCFHRFCPLLLKFGKKKCFLKWSAGKSLDPRGRGPRRGLPALEQAGLVLTCKGELLRATHLRGRSVPIAVRHPVSVCLSSPQTTWETPVVRPPMGIPAPGRGPCAELIPGPWNPSSGGWGAAHLSTAEKVVAAPRM